MAPAVLYEEEVDLQAEAVVETGLSPEVTVAHRYGEPSYGTCSARSGPGVSCDHRGLDEPAPGAGRAGCAGGAGIQEPHRHRRVRCVRCERCLQRNDGTAAE